MTRKVLSPIPYYWVRIPPRLVPVFNRIMTLPTFSWDFNELAKILSKSDMLNLMHEQIICPDFVKLQDKCGVSNISQLPENILWLEKMKDDYQKYVYLYEDLAKIRINRGEKPYDFQNDIPWTHRYQLMFSKRNQFKQGSVIVFLDSPTLIDRPNEVETAELSVYHQDEIIAKRKEIKRQLRQDFLERVGYMIWRTHPLTVWGLNTSNE